MKSEDRRKQIISLLITSKNPITGAELSNRFEVSRQIIVQDISRLKAAGYDIFSTHCGYILQSEPFCTRTFKFYHTAEQTEDKLNTIVDLGGTVIDVFVWHKVYGKVEASLNISSRLHVKQFIDGVRSGKSTELMNITGGYHYHTVRAETNETLNEIEKALNQKGYLAPEK